MNRRFGVAAPETAIYRPKLKYRALFDQVLWLSSLPHAGQVKGDRGFHPVSNLLTEYNRTSHRAHSLATISRVSGASDSL